MVEFMHRSFSEILKHELRDSKITQVELAKRVGISKSRISAYVRGYHCPNDGIKKKIALAFGKPEDYFMDCGDKIDSIKPIKKNEIGTEGCAWGSWGGIGGKKLI